MPARRYRSRTYKQHLIRTPGGKPVVHYREKRANIARCASCGRPLSGVPRAGETRSLPRSLRMPNRPYGGYLCSSCMRQIIKKAAHG